MSHITYPTPAELMEGKCLLQKVEVWNSRVFKTAANTDGNDKDEYEIRFASKQLTDEPDTTAEQLIGHKEEYKGRMFKFTRGDYSEVSISLQ